MISSCFKHAELLIWWNVAENAGSFMWFSHMWNHQQPHLYDNLTQLEMDMSLNREFAKVIKGLPLMTLIFGIKNVKKKRRERHLPDSRV